MSDSGTFADRVMQSNITLARDLPTPPEGFSLRSPYSGILSEKVLEAAAKFYDMFYSDNRKRVLVLGSSPARRGSAATGVPFEDANHLAELTGVSLGMQHASKGSADFLSEVIMEYGGYELFYSNFCMGFVCPVGIVRVAKDGRETNANYYDTRKLQDSLNPLLLRSLKSQASLGVSDAICICVGSSGNYRYLSCVNEAEGLFGKIIALEHPRYIMQYNRHRKSEFVRKYLDAFRFASESVVD